ncbi:hypothetical protein DOFOFD_08800 [Acetobacteraceae bacterium EV16P]|uniref:Uncharacterized protein n=1 Tax=Sorlinia euscelidii TaxID=3081148 RepID=A0ABU7U3Q6_9PROT
MSSYLKLRGQAHAVMERFKRRNMGAVHLQGRYSDVILQEGRALTPGCEFAMAILHGDPMIFPRLHVLTHDDIDITQPPKP